MNHHAEPERRKDPRYEVAIQVGLETLDAFQSNYVSNISKGGAFIKTEKPLPVQSEITLTLNLPGINREIKARAKVAWNFDREKGSGKMQTGMGIKFLDMHPETLSLLVDYLAEVAKNQKPLP